MSAYRAVLESAAVADRIRACGSQGTLPVIAMWKIAAAALAMLIALEIFVLGRTHIFMVLLELVGGMLVGLLAMCVVYWWIYGAVARRGRRQSK